MSEQSAPDTRAPIPRRRAGGLKVSRASLAALVVAGAALLSLGVATQRDEPPSPPVSTEVASQPPTQHESIKALPESAPTRLDIPAIGVHSDLLGLGLNPDGTVEVPPYAENSQAGWYTHSPTPGALGPAVILGHVDSAQFGPGIFFKLGALRTGDLIQVSRADGTIAAFRVDQVSAYPKSDFPTSAVYGDTNVPALRLITCGGTFDQRAHSYEDNIVVFASLQ